MADAWRRCALLLMLLSLACARVSGAAPNSRPIVGMLTQPTDSDPVFVPYGKTYLPASYVKWVESAGGRVVPIQYDADLNTLKGFFNSINGLLLPGGDVYLPGSLYQNVTRQFYVWAMKAYDHGDYFPIWGTCQGFEQLAMLASGNESILTNFSGEDLTLALTFTEKAPSSRMWSYVPHDVYEAFAAQNLTENLHSLGVSPASYAASRLFASSWDVLSTDLDRDGKTFLSSMEARRYPFYGVQFHPERNAFEWDTGEPIVHSSMAVRAMHSLAQFFVDEARKSAHAFPNKDAEYAALIYNYDASYTEKANPFYEQTYFW